MKKLFSLSLIALVFALGLSLDSYGFCVRTGPNGPGNVIDCPTPIQVIPLNPFVNAPNNTTFFDDIVTIPLNGGVIVGPEPLGAVDTSFGSDMVTVSGNIVGDIIGLNTGLLIPGSDTVIVNPGANISGGTGILTGGSADFVQINGGSVVGTAIAALFTGGGPDTVEINGGNVDGGFFLSFSTDFGDDMLTINDGTFNGPISMGFGNDTARLNGGTYNFLTLGMGPGDDTLHITNNIPDIGLLSCGENIFGPGDDDTLIFSMQVPANEVAQLSQDFINAGESGSLEVNGVTYSWVFCENRIPNFNGVVTTIELSPIGAINPVGTDHTVDAEVSTNVGGPTEGLLVTFEINEGPNAGLDSGSDGTCSPNPDCTTDSNGEVSWTYTSNGLVGIDTIVATTDDQFIGMTSSNTVEKEWENVPLEIPTLSEWGLIAMASILGIVGFMVVRRRQVVA